MEEKQKASLPDGLSLALSIILLLALLAYFFAARSPGVLSVLPVNKMYAREAMFWKRTDSGIMCLLCPNYCFLTEGARGKCRVRINKDNILYTLVYGQPAALHIDPIEKKPVFHMLPGSMIFSIATVGCPLTCSFCQNWNISQAYPEENAGDYGREGRIVTPMQIVQAALHYGNNSIAYTYSEPVIFYEYMLETARIARQNGLRNVMVTAGYINPEPLREIAPYFDVIKVDLKGYNEKFYSAEVGGHLTNVLRTLKMLKKMNKLVEIVNLVIPQRNDSDEDLKNLCNWIRDNMGQDTPLFFTRYLPNYRLNNLPPTPLETLLKARAYADRAGLHYVYIGNAPEAMAENTYCPNCHTLLIEREGYWIKRNILKNGRCPVCGKEIPGIWK
jgi:pyruvate formate lyase activating enzyme